MILESWLLNAWRQINIELDKLYRKAQRRNTIEALYVHAEVEDLVTAEEFPKLTWPDRKELATQLIRADCYRGLAVADSMEYLLKSLLQTYGEKRWAAEEIWVSGTAALCSDVALPLFRELGMEEPVYTPPKKDDKWLQDQWAYIAENLEELSLEPYLDDQIQIQYIWDRADEMRKSGRLSAVSWEDRKNLALLLIQNDCYEELSVWDPLSELLLALPQTDEEKKYIAEVICKGGYGFLYKDIALPLYRELGIDPHPLIKQPKKRRW